LAFLHRAFAALAAIWERFLGASLAALAAPPLRPPRRPRATACGFLVGSIGVAISWLGSYFGTWPVAS
jgi:ferric-dicitrate binding protein FerR (iron transport regulator)